MPEVGEAKADRMERRKSGIMECWKNGVLEY
jgi:hypothetical protein